MVTKGKSLKFKVKSSSIAKAKTNKESSKAKAVKRVVENKKGSEPEKVSLVLDETHVEVTEENISPQGVPERKELAEKLFSEKKPDEQSKQPVEQKAAPVGTTLSEEEPYIPTLPAQHVENASPSAPQSRTSADEQAKVDQMVSQSAVVDQAADDEAGMTNSSASSEQVDQLPMTNQTEPITNDQEPTTNNAVTLEESNGLRWVLILIILFLVGLMGGLFYFFILQNKTPEKPKSNLKTVAVYTPSPSPTTVAKNTYVIRVLNGSGIAGQAASVQTLLTGEGYNVPDIGNADNSNYTKTKIQAKSTVDKTYLSNLEKDLSAKYTVDTTVSPTTGSETDDVVVIIGSTTK